jgi:caffeoyl-CoA O-methyltransferase
MFTNQEIEQYINDHSSPEDEVLAELYRQTYNKTVHPQMIAGQIQGRFLEMVSRMIQPEYILEIGTFTGYSAICLARGLKQGGQVYTIDIDEEVKELAATFIKKAGMDGSVITFNGDAKDIIPCMNQKFDLVYIDAEKDEYIDYYNLVIRKVKPGGFILADNVLWSGKVIQQPGSNDHFTKGIIAFNEMIQNDSRVENVILPFRDGISLIRKL